MEEESDWFESYPIFDSNYMLEEANEFDYDLFSKFDDMDNNLNEDF